jgi:hypothetical protein
MKMKKRFLGLLADLASTQDDMMPQVIYDTKVHGVADKVTIETEIES